MAYLSDLFAEVARICFLRSSPFGGSRKFALKEFCELRIDAVLRSSAKGSSRTFANLRHMLLLRAHHQHWAGSVADNSIGDAPLDGSPYPPMAPATHHDQVRPELLGQSHNLQVHLPHPEVSSGHCAPGHLHPPRLLPQQLPRLLLDLLVE